MAKNTDGDYKLDEQIGFMLRRASQRSNDIFAQLMPPELTPTRFAAIAKLYEKGALSQNELGRHTAMDVATIKGVVERLKKLDYVAVSDDPDDKRKHLVQLTPAGRELFETVRHSASTVTRQTLKPLEQSDRRTLMELLQKIG